MHYVCAFITAISIAVSRVSTCYRRKPLLPSSMPKRRPKNMKLFQAVDQVPTLHLSASDTILKLRADFKPYNLSIRVKILKDELLS